MTSKLTREERETYINYCEADGFYEIETSIQSHIRKFDRLNYECTDTQFYEDNSVCSKRYRVPKFAISFKKPVKVTRELTDEQRAAIRDRFHSGKANTKK